MPTWRVRVASRERRLVRKCASLAARSAQKARRVFQICAEAVVVGDGVLDDERFNALGMREGHAETDRAAIVLHV